MYSAFQIGFKYLNYLLTASNGRGHGIHSPFVYAFVKNVLNDKQNYGDFKKVEAIRSRMERDDRVLSVDDYGAGSTSSSSNRSVSSLAKRTIKSRKYSQLLYKMAKYYKPTSIIELGTSLGITTSYLGLAGADANVITMEGAHEVAAIAKQNFADFGLKNIRLIEGNFNYTLPTALHQLNSVDFAFIDGNHRRDPTLNYFDWLLQKRSNDSVFIFDDIHWSGEMEQAWKAIEEHPAVQCSIDLFFLGIVFFRNEFKQKQHFTIRF